jgi:FkbM family methyltransferase
MKRLVVWLVNRLGYAIVPHWRLGTEPAVVRLRELFARRQIDQVIDAGANEGQFYKVLRRQVGFAGRIASFEPVPQLAARLQQQSAGDPLWTVHACALGRTAGELDLNVTKRSVFSSFLSPLADDPSEGGNVVVQTVRVPVRTLDAMFPDAAALRHTYLKLDTQGFDLEVAAGAEHALHVIPALQTEVSFRAIYGGMPGYQQSIGAFERYGFQVGDFFLVSTDRGGIAYEFDCIMLRSLDDAAAV